MNIEDIKELIRSNNSNNCILSLSDLVKLKKAVNIELNIDRDNGNYFYQIDLNDFIDKDFDINILKENKWVLSPDETKIFLFI